MDGVVIILSLFVPSSETSVRIQTKLKYPPFFGGEEGVSSVTRFGEIPPL